MIKVSGLTKAYGKKIAVKDLSFAIGQGERVGFLGPNGAGKTTTMNMLTGYLASSYGKIEIGGFDLLENPAKAKQCIGYLPEIPPLYTDMTVWEYLCFAFDLKKCRFNKKAHLEEICQVVKLEEVRGRLIRNLSKGYKQRVGLAQALIGDPPILILDEPTVGLDPKEIVEIRNLIRRLGSTRTVILSSHILSEVQAVCQRVMILKDGELILDASAEELTVVPGANSRYGVRLTAPENEVIPVLSQLPGVARVEYVGSYEAGTVDIILEADQRVDIRKILFEECAKRSWYILMITPLGMSLEDVFLRLTEQEPSSPALSEEKEPLPEILPENVKTPDSSREDTPEQMKD